MTIMNKIIELGNSIINLVNTRADRSLSNLSEAGMSILNNKQNTLVAGTGISIVGNVISANGSNSGNGDIVINNGMTIIPYGEPYEIVDPRSSTEEKATEATVTFQQISPVVGAPASYTSVTFKVVPPNDAEYSTGALSVPASFVVPIGSTIQMTACVARDYDPTFYLVNDYTTTPFATSQNFSLVIDKDTNIYYHGSLSK